MSEAPLADSASQNDEEFQEPKTKLDDLFDDEEDDDDEFSSSAQNRPDESSQPEQSVTRAQPRTRSILTVAIENQARLQRPQILN